VVLPAVQTVAASQPQAVFAPAYSDKIQSNVGSAGWNQALGTKITWMATAGMQSASLSLNPPDLGPMQVVLNVHNQQADATFITAQPEVKQALEAAMPKLREMMDQAGIQLGQANVQTGMPNQQQVPAAASSRHAAAARAASARSRKAMWPSVAPRQPARPPADSGWSTPSPDRHEPCLAPQTLKK
jgi:flagellar hook-length control protein FliK